MNQTFEVFYEATPNPQSMKFNVSAQIANETISFDDPLKAQRSPLALKLFGFPWTSSILLGPNFITLTKQDWVEWSQLADPLCELIKEHLENGEAVLNELPEESVSTVDPNDTPTVQNIKKLLDTEIRPAVAMDGGDIRFHKFEKGILYLEMQGACSGCPSSMITLKEGIETRLKREIPELLEVLQV